MLFSCGICESTDSLSMRLEQEQFIEYEYINFVRLIGENLEWTEISSEAIITTVLYKNYITVPIICSNFKYA